jgi:hypothetical protein
MVATADGDLAAVDTDLACNIICESGRAAATSDEENGCGRFALISRIFPKTAARFSTAGRKRQALRKV